MVPGSLRTVSTPFIENLLMYYKRVYDSLLCDLRIASEFTSHQFINVNQLTLFLFALSI